MRKFFSVFLSVCLMLCCLYCFGEDGHIHCERITAENAGVVSEQTRSFISEQMRLNAQLTFPEAKADDMPEIFILYHEYVPEDRIICAVENALFGSPYYVLLHERKERFGTDISVIGSGVLEGQKQKLSSITLEGSVPSTDCYFEDAVPLENGSDPSSDVPLYILLGILIVLCAISIFIQIRYLAVSRNIEQHYSVSDAPVR